ncbi:hypothetical protein Y1Q_0010581 [Alligator mississippiensis]|uniref:T-cell receptor alpha chain constant domain-containing protein n=1 Tax=Alligator mississippiensis TaxID=8496 RepID=A0A151PGH0_ALLMI|nr:hypothetical protein Y1Q_0010581 [Alligator mississippiensis]
MHIAVGNYGGGNTQLIFGKGTKLSVKPNLQDSDPSIYKLKSPETHISACLITDYFPDNIRISNKEKNESFQSSIIEVRNPESNKKEASYGGVHWFESDFDGYVNHSLHFTSKCPEDTEDEEDTCITMKMSDNFETDEHLNLMSFMELRCERNVNICD